MALPVVSFLLVTLASVAGIYFMPRLLRDRKKIRERLHQEFGENSRNDSASALFKDLDALNFGPAEEYALLNSSASAPRPANPSLRKRLEAELQAAHLSLNAAQFIGIVSSLAISLGVLGTLLMRWPGGIVGFLCGSIVPFIFTHWRRAARRERFLKQLPNAFELMARVIRAGQSVVQAFQAVSEAFDDPLAGEFANCQHQQNLGLRPDVVLQEMANRSDIVELRIFAMAMLIQRQTGGNLTEVLDRLAALIRSRLRLRQQVRSLTAEGRLQGITLSILPVVMFVAMYFLNRRYALVLLDHSSLLLGMAACMGIGMLWIRRIVNYEG